MQDRVAEIGGALRGRGLRARQASIQAGGPGSSATVRRGCGTSVDGSRRSARCPTSKS